MKNKPYDWYYCENHETIKELLENCVRKYSDRTAFAYKIKKDLKKITFREFSEDVYALAAYFTNKGYNRSRLALLGENSYAWLVTWFGTVISGNIVVPIDRLLNEEQFIYILNDTEANAIVYSKQYEDFAKSYSESNTGVEIFPLEQGFDDYINAGKAILKEKGKEIIPVTFDKETAIIIYTSGTTGTAKGVALSQENICADSVAISKSLKSAGHNMLTLPLNHAYALQGVLVSFGMGQASYICSGLKRFASEIKEFAPTEMYLVPLFVETLYDKIMTSAREQGKEKLIKRMIKISLALYSVGIDVRRKLFKSVLAEFGGNLQYMLCGGAAIDPMYVKAFRAFGIDIFIGYGITECSPVISVNRNEYYRDGSAGIALDSVDIKTDAPDGRSEGELYVRGKMVMGGYYKNEEATRETFEDGWFKTGDIGYLDEDGFVFITGRKKNIIILSNGKNLYPEELEQQLMRIEAISEVLVYEDNRCVAAEIFPNEDWLKLNGISDAEAYIRKAVEDYNKTLTAGKNITKITLRDTCFEKTSTKKIIRNRG